MRNELTLNIHGTKTSRIVCLVKHSYHRLKMRAKSAFHRFYKRLICNEVSLTAEFVFLDLVDASISENSEVYIFVRHGRLNHWINATIRLYALALKRGWKPRLLELSNDAFPGNIASRFRAHILSTNKSFPPKKKVCLYSDEIAYFTLPEFGQLLKCISPVDESRARSLLSNELAPLCSILRELPLDLLALCGINNRVEFDKTLAVSIHLRRGDLAVLWRKDYIGTVLEDLFQNDVLLIVDKLPNSIPDSNPLAKISGDWAFVSYNQYEELKKLSCCHAIYRKEWAKPLNDYIEKVNSFKERATAIKGKETAQLLVLVFSDGFDRVAQFLSKSSDRHDFMSIKSEIEKIELGTLKGLDNYHLFIGEPHPLVGLSSLLAYAMNADLVLAEDSGFPMTLFKLLLENEGAKFS